MCALPNLYGEHFREIMQSLAQHSAVSTGAMKVMGYVLHMKWIFFLHHQYAMPYDVGRRTWGVTQR